MAKILPCLCALILSLAGMNIFGSSYSQAYLEATSPLFAGSIVRLGMYFLLLDINIYRKSFRRIHPAPQALYEFIVAAFLMDSVVMCIWYPVENSILSAMLKNVMMPGCSPGSFLSSVNCLIAFLLTPYVLVFICYFLSVLYLCCILHATRAVDFRLIRAAGVIYFLEESFRCFKKGISRAFPFMSYSECKVAPCSSPPRRRRRRCY